MPRLRQNDLSLGMAQAGMTHQAVADHFDVSRITISRSMIRLRQTDRTNVRPHNDRRRVTSQRQGRNLRLIHLRKRMIMTEKLPVEHLVSQISEFRVSRRLRESVLRARRPVIGPILKQRHRTARLAWARAHYRWILHTWQHILFNDESQFSLRFSDGRYRVYRRCGERFTDQCVYESDRFGGGSVMV
jgi:hypothetical protein